MLGIDRLDYTKGLPLKLEAWRKLLSSSPRWRSRAMLIQLAIPSRENIESYREQKEEVERLVGEINGLYGAPGRIPIHYMYQSVSREELGALYRLADVGLVTPVRDGMNLVARSTWPAVMTVVACWCSVSSQVPHRSSVSLSGSTMGHRGHCRTARTCA